jgi:Protein kinase domain
LLGKGTMLAGYRVDGVLGEGGMGIVYRATQLSLNRTVALKVIAAELGDDTGFRERFRREGLLQAAIEHPHIVTVYEAGETEHGLFLAMRLVRGPTLKDMILGREIDAGRSLRILAQVADALDTAHEVGLIHRDIKPQNILVAARDHAYLADFGLTKAPGEVSLTETGQFVATIDYASPEQIQSDPPTIRSDVYALAGVLYECLTGQVPYPRPTEAAVLFAHMSDPPPRVSEHRSDLPAELDDVIAEGMAKAPESRPASASELIRNAERSLGEEVGGAIQIPGPLETPEEAGVRDAGVAAAGAPTAAAATVGAASARPGAPAAAAPTVPSTRQRERARSLALVGLAALIAIAAAAGFVAGGSGSEEGSVALTSSASAGSLGLSFPDDWTRVTAEPQVPGIDFADPIVLEPGTARGSRLVAGQVDAAGPTLLPADFVKRLAKAPSRGDPVRLGKLEAYRYAGLRPEGFDRRLVLYTVANSGGVATVACVAEPRVADAFLPDCEQAAGTLQLSGAVPFGLAPSEEYARLVRRTIERLDSQRAAGARALRAARTPEAQAKAAAALGRAYSAASRGLRRARVSPAVKPAHSSLAAALGRVGDAYDRAAGAARRGDSGAYAAASRAVRRQGARARRALNTLEDLGYSVS